MRRKQLIILILAVFAITIALTSIFYSYYYIDEVKEISMDFKVGDTIGLNAGTDALHFGTIPPGNLGFRNITIANLRSYPVRVSLVMKGNIAQFVSVSDSSFVLGGGKAKELRFTAAVPSGASFGNYSGSVILYFKRA